MAILTERSCQALLPQIAVIGDENAGLPSAHACRQDSRSEGVPETRGAEGCPFRVGGPRRHPSGSRRKGKELRQVHGVLTVVVARVPAAPAFTA